jgi:Asp-tRNA(Asn)/Glu-tRNA(Gln) amidotransferase A subunit family amidase
MRESIPMKNRMKSAGCGSMTGKPNFPGIVGGAFLIATVCLFAPVATAMSHEGAMSHDEMIRMGFVEAVEALRSGKISATEYNQACLKQAVKFEEYNILSQMSRSYVTTIAAAVDEKRKSGTDIGMLQGVPYAIKDAVDVLEYYTIAGHPSMKTFEPLVDADLVKIYRENDGICLGKTQLPPLAAWYTTENTMTGYTGNPFNKAYKTGGSSGGSGAAVAARIVPFAIAEDTGGSIRVPAALNGVQGFRPTTGRWPTEGTLPICFSDTLGPITRSIADIKLLDTISSVDHPENRPSRVRLNQIRIGYQKEWFLEDLHKWIEENVNETMETLSGAGIIFVEVKGMPAASCHENIYTAAFSELPGNVARYFDRHRVYDMSSFGLFHEFNVDAFKKMWLKGFDDTVTGEDYFPVVVQILEDRKTYIRIMTENKIDAFMYPTTKIPNIPNDSPEVMEHVGPLGEMLKESRFGDNMLFSPAQRTPSISMFSGLDDRGLPLSVTFDGYSGEDRRLLDIAEAIEKVLPPIVEPDSI